MAASKNKDLSAEENTVFQSPLIVSRPPIQLVRCSLSSHKALFHLYQCTIEGRYFLVGRKPFCTYKQIHIITVKLSYYVTIFRTIF